jgi:hypothetical protein
MDAMSLGMTGIGYDSAMERSEAGGTISDQQFSYQHVSYQRSAVSRQLQAFQ